MKNIKSILLLVLVLAASLAIVKLPTKLGLDLQGGLHLILQAKPTNNQPLTQDAVLGSLEIIRNRIDALGLTEPVIRQKGSSQISLELPGIKDPEMAKALIGKTAQLEFIKAEWVPDGIQNLPKEKQKILIGENAVLSTLIEKNAEGNVIRQKPIVLKEIVLTGADLKSASAGADQFNNPVVNIEFNTQGSKKFYSVTSTHINKPLAIKLDDTLISAPNIREAIVGGHAQISGSFTPAEVKNLVIQLQAGALPIPVEIISEKIVGPTLGKDSITKSQKAFAIGVFLIFVYMFFFYRLAGLLSIAALFVYILVTAALFKLFGITLTLTGIAGFILTIGMAVDANIIIFERIKEEIAENASQVKAIETGFNKAYVTILDSNITTLISAVILFWLGTGSIKGFAIALSIGIIISMFSAITVTKHLLLLAANKNLFGKRALK